MQIQILNVVASNPTNSAGKPYSKLEVAFKNLTFQGKVEGKQLMGFGATKPAHDVLILAQPGETYEIEVKKNDRGYNDWVSAVKGGTPNVGNASPTFAPYPAGPRPAAVAGTTPTASPRSTYETPEERAKKQIYIVRQSSISNAVDLLSVGQKSPPDVKAVIEAAKQFEDFVFNGHGDEPEGTPKPAPKSDFSDMSDDIPF